MPGHRRVRSTRQAGKEFEALGWLLRHPLFLLVPAAILAALIQLGPLPTVADAGRARAGGAGVVARASGLVRPLRRPPTAHALAALGVPTAAAAGRGVLADCDLVKEHRRTGDTLVPAR